MPTNAYKDFSGGLNLQDDPRLVSPRETPNALNVYGGETGKLRPRKGYIPIQNVGWSGGPFPVTRLGVYVGFGQDTGPGGGTLSIGGSSNSGYGGTITTPLISGNTGVGRACRMVPTYTAVSAAGYTFTITDTYYHTYADCGLFKTNVTVTGPTAYTLVNLQYASSLRSGNSYCTTTRVFSWFGTIPAPACEYAWYTNKNCTSMEISGAPWATGTVQYAVKFSYRGAKGKNWDTVTSTDNYAVFSPNGRLILPSETDGQNIIIEDANIYKVTWSVQCY